MVSLTHFREQVIFETLESLHHASCMLPQEVFFGTKQPWNWHTTNTVNKSESLGAACKLYVMGK